MHHSIMARLHRNSDLNVSESRHELNKVAAPPKARVAAATKALFNAL